MRSSTNLLSESDDNDQRPLIIVKTNVVDVNTPRTHEEGPSCPSWPTYWAYCHNHHHHLISVRPFIDDVRQGAVSFAVQCGVFRH